MVAIFEIFLDVDKDYYDASIVIHCPTFVGSIGRPT